MSAVPAWPETLESAPTINWRGQSGRYYALASDCIETFHLSGDDLFVLELENKALWVGSAADVIESSERRFAFKKALDICSSVMSCSAPVEVSDRVAMIWDIENGELAGQLRLVEPA